MESFRCNPESSPCCDAMDTFRLGKREVISATSRLVPTLDGEMAPDWIQSTATEGDGGLSPCRSHCEVEGEEERGERKRTTDSRQECADSVRDVRD